MVSHWSLSGHDSPQVFRTLLSILANLYYAVAWMVSTCPLHFKSSSPFTNLLGNVPRAPNTIGITVTFVLVFNWNHFEMRFLNLRINFFFFKFGRNVVKEETTQKKKKKKTTKMRKKKAAINKKLILRLRNLISKWFQLKTSKKNSVRTRLWKNK